MSFSHTPDDGWHSGTGDAELAIKYRFFNDPKHGLSAAIFPRVILPTASHAPGEKTRLLLPLWLQKDFAGGTSLFGGGGYRSIRGRETAISGRLASRSLTTSARHCRSA